MIRLWWLLQAFVQREDGQNLLEYALVIVLVALVVIVALTLLRGPIDAAFQLIFG